MDLRVDYEKLKQFLLYSGLALLPFQNLNIKFGSVYDLSAIILLIYIVLLCFGKIKKNMDVRLKKDINYLAIFFIAQILIFLFTSTPLYRLVSGLVWIGGLILIILFREKIEINFLKAYKILFITMTFTSIMVFIQFFLNHKPQGFFTEPSFAGLVLYSTSVSYFGCFLFNKSPKNHKLKALLLGTLFFIAGLLTKSMHIFSFLIVAFFALYVSPKKNNFLKVFILLFFIGLYICITSPIQDRINTFIVVFNKPDSLLQSCSYQLPTCNMSTLAWLDGLNQALAAIRINPFTGLGLGSTGFFNHHSIYDTWLEALRGSNPNKLDSYSGLFRIIIELGIVLPLVGLNLIFKRLSLFKLKFQPTFELLFLRFFSLTMIIGVLIKEPTYSRSIVYVAVLLFSTSFIQPRTFKL